MTYNGRFTQRALFALPIVFLLLISGCATPYELDKALTEGDNDKLKKMLEEGADPNQPLPPVGLRPLGIAMLKTYPFDPYQFRLLIDYGADISLSLSENSNISALSGARTSQAVEAVLGEGVNINQRDTKGMTALFNAHSKSIRVLKKLIDEGADPTLEDNEGKSAIDYMKRFRDSQRQLMLEHSSQGNVGQAKRYRASSIKAESKIALMEKRNIDQAQIARNYPEIEDNRQVVANQLAINNNSGEYLSPYTSDGVTAEWVNQAINADIGANVGIAAGAATGSAVAGTLSDNFASVALVSMAGAAIGEAIGRQVAIEASGGWEHIRATSDISFRSLEDMARYLRLKHSNNENFEEVFKATLQVYPDLAD